MTDRSFKLRLLVGVSLTVLALAAMTVKVVRLHLANSENVRSRVTRLTSVRKSLVGLRGSIYDCQERQNVLAMSLAGRSVCASPKVLCETRHVEEAARLLSERLGLPRQDLLARFSRPDDAYERVLRYIPEGAAADLEKQKVPGLSFEDVAKRYYPQSNFLCHVIGFVNDEGAGSAGVEQRVNRYLCGSEGATEVQVDAVGQPVPGRDNLIIPALPGADVFLTVDQNLQYTVEHALEDVIAAQRAKAACAIIERVQTGEILAMASRPGYDLNRFSGATEEQRMNRAVGMTYEPGSTLKLVAFSAALQEGLITPETTFDCENGVWFHSGRPLRDYHPYGILNVADGLKKSSNIMTAKIAVMLGPDRLYGYLRSFGLGGRLGFDLPGEETGILHPVPRWSGLSITRIPIGQGIAVTPLQMIGLYCAVANDGFLMQPYVIRRIVAADGTVLLDRKPHVLGRPLKAETAATMRKLLARVTEEGGTGHRASVAGYDVAGKTGTAQKPEGGGYSSTRHMATFVGFIPASAPEIGIIVVVDEPAAAHTGGVVAAPAFSRIAEMAVRYLGIPPTLKDAAPGPETSVAQAASAKARARH